MTSINEILEIEYDKAWGQFDRNEFKSLHDCISNNVYSDYAYCLYHHCAFDKDYSFYKIRIYRLCDIDGQYIFFVSSAIKKNEVNMAKVKVPTVVNKLNLVKGDVVKIDDLPPLLDYKNSYYDPKLKRRVPNPIQLKEPEKKVKETNEPKEKTTAVKREKTEDLVIRDYNIFAPNMPKQSDFLEPRICTRIWTLGIGIESGWGWYLKEQEGYKYKFEFYCRPTTILDGFEAYDKGGDFMTHAYMKWEYPALCNEALAHDNLSKIYKENGNATDAQLILNVLIDSFIINWKL